MMRGKKRGRVETDKLVVAIIVVIAVIIGILAFVYFGGYEKVKSLFPDFLKMNYTIETPVQCPDGSIEIGYLDNKGVINLNGKSTSMYVKDSKIFFDDGKKWTGVYPQIGFIQGAREGSNVLMNPEFNPDSKYTYNTNVFLPDSKTERRLLSNSFFEGSLICVKQDISDRINNMNSCVLTCALVDGICRSKSGGCKSGELYNGQTDCPSDQDCCVKETAEVLSTENIQLLPKSFFESVLSGKTTKLGDILKTKGFDALPGTYYALVMYVNRKIPICYSFDTNSNYIDKGYLDANSDEKTNFIAPKQLQYSKEKMVEFVAWNPEKNEKVIKRWKLVGAGVEELGFEPGTIILDGSNFISTMVDADIGDRFYIFAQSRNDWKLESSIIDLIPTGENIQTYYYTWKYKLEKISNSRVSIYAYDEREGEWRELACGKGLYRSININDLSDTLKETIDNSCWKMRVGVRDYRRNKQTNLDK